MAMKKVLSMVAILSAAMAFGKVNDTVISFSTPGPDTYGDGTSVLNGECYALVWTKDGAKFGGISADCKPLAATDKLLLIAPVARNGRCPTTVLEIDADYAEANLAGGKFSVYLLDTRVSATQLAKVVKGVPQVVNRVGAVSVDAQGEAVAASASGLGNSLSAGSPVALADVGVYSEIASPTITAMDVKDAKVTLKVSRMSEAADYFVVPGKTPGNFSKSVSAQQDGDTFTFDAPEGHSFFKVIGVRKFR